MNEMEPGSNMNLELVSKSLNFHGQLLQKTWETEHGEGNLQKLGITNLDFAIYSQRQKHLSFQDRGKRLKLHQFIAKRANVLFDTSLVEREEPRSRNFDLGHFAVMPPFENFLNLDKASRAQHFLSCLGVGEVVIGQITNKTNSGLFLKILCLDGENARNVSDLGIKGFCPTSNLISAVDKKGVPRSFLMNDFVACEVLEVMPDLEKIVCSMKGVHVTEEQKARLGLFHSDDFPEAYKLPQEGKNEPYEEMLEKSVGFHNPTNVTCLATFMGLGNLHHTNIVALKGRFPEAEYATELRSLQAAKWAFRSVADGIEHFKAGRTTEAFQCLNKALSIDSSNIEGLVARGALYANGGSFKKAIDDFECALKLNPSHANARKYMGETLVAYGRSFEDLSQTDDALKMYEKCLEIVPYHEEAQNSIEYIRVKRSNGNVSLTDGLVPSLTSKTQGVKDTLKQLLVSEQQTTKEEVTGSSKKKKKEKKAKKHKRHSSSSSSSSSGSSSSSSSSTSSSDTSSASSNDSHRKKKHKSRKSETKEKSLSPLSKRMAIMDSSATSETDGQRGSHYNPPAMPYSFSSDPASSAPMYASSSKTDKESEYEQRVCKFLEQTKGDSDYEEKVRKFLDETAKWKKERKAIEEKAKKKRKKEKKARSKSKKKKREERKKKKMIKEIEEKKLREALRKQRRRSNLDDDEEFLYGEKPDLRLSLPDLEDLQSKLSYYVKVEKGNTSKKKEKSSSVEKLVAAAQAKKASSPKGVLLLEEELREEARARKLAEKKKLDMFEDSPPQIRPPDAKNVPLPSGAPPLSSSKFKMQIGSTQTRLKKRGDKSEEKDSWDDVGEKRFIYMNEAAAPSKEVETKKLPEKKKEVEEQLAKAPMILDKLGGFRINPLNAEKKLDEVTPQKRKLRPRVSESESSDSDAVAKKKERGGRSPPSSRSRSRSRSHKKYSSESPPPKKYSSSSSRSPSYRKDRSRSKSGSYRSDRERERRRYRSSESGSYRSRSYSRSRSRSRSMDYHRRSRSRSDDRHRYHKYPGRYPRNRGTYYRPRFQTGFKTRPGGFFPRGRGGPWRPGGRPFIPRMRGRGRPRFFHNNYKPRDDRYRRYERDMSRSDDDDGSPMRKVDAAKERIDRMLNEDKRHTGPLSEGEERDDDYIDRKDYDRERPRPSSSPELDRGKKEGSKERKSSGKPNPW